MLQLSGGSEVSREDNADDEDGAKKFVFAHRSIDYVIEEGIRCIMDVEDVENLLYANATTPEE